MRKILLVEDELNIRENVAALLSMSGYEVNDVASVAEALEAIKTFTPDLILCDIVMPGAHGYILLQTLQNSEKLKNTPFIFLTAKAELSDIRKGMNLGADDYITKPFKQEELIQAINTRLQKLRVRKVTSGDELNILKSKLEKISDSELRVLRLLGEGKSSTIIAQELFVSYKTVQNHRSNMVRKLDYSGYNALYNFAVKCKAAGLI